MRSTELALRKELAITRLRVARAELMLATTARPNQLATVSNAVDLASSLLDGRGGKWAGYLRVFFNIAHVILAVRRSL